MQIPSFILFTTFEKGFVHATSYTNKQGKLVHRKAYTDKRVAKKIVAKDRIRTPWTKDKTYREVKDKLHTERDSLKKKLEDVRAHKEEILEAKKDGSTHTKRGIKVDHEHHLKKHENNLHEKLETTNHKIMLHASHQSLLKEKIDETREKARLKRQATSKEFKSQSEYMDWYRKQSPKIKDEHKLNKKDGKLIATWGKDEPEKPKSEKYQKLADDSKKKEESERLKKWDKTKVKIEAYAKKTEAKKTEAEKTKSRSEGMKGNKNAYKGGPKEEPSKPKKIVVKGEKISDFGKKIGGARKDQWKDKYLEGKDLEDLNDREILKHVKRDKIWPKPDYDQMIKDGTDPVVAYLMNEVRSKLPATFKIATSKAGQMKEFAKHYIKLVESTRDAVLKLKKPEDFSSLMGTIYHDEYKHTGMTGTGWKPNRGEPSKMYFTTNKFLRSFRVDTWDIRKAKEKIDKGWGLSEPWKKGATVSKSSDGYVLNVGVFDAYSGNPHKTEKDAFDFAKVRYEALKGVEVYDSNRLIQDNKGEPVRDKDGNQKTERSFYVTKGAFIIAEEKTRSELEKKLIDLHLKKGPKKSNRRQKFVRPQLKGIERTGTDHRKGKGAKTDNFVDIFGFRGGEFGNWNTQADRQQNLDHAHDAFMDLSDVLGLDPKEVSLKGDLSIAFGARGKGGASFAAHYEPARKVINLTKMKGAGSLAHEWGHAFDDYLMKSTGVQGSGEENYATQTMKNLDSFLPNGSGAAFKEIMGNINSRKMTKEEYVDKKNKEIKRTQNNMKHSFDSIRTRLTEERTLPNGKKVRSATEAELKEFDEVIVPSILGGRVEGETTVQDGKTKIAFMPDKVHYLTNVFYKKIKGHFESTSKPYLVSGHERIGFLEKQKNELDPIMMKTDSKFYEGAVATQKAFSGKAGYWTSNVEMFARAFESYVHDKISDKGEKSQYLVHSTSNGAYAMFQMEDGTIPKPYPEGDERIAINKAFDKFFSKLRSGKSLPEHKLKKSFPKFILFKAS